MAISDLNQSIITRPSPDWFDITPDDEELLPYSTRAIYVGGSGDIAVESVNGSTSTFYNVIAGMFYPWQARRVYFTGTTATNIVGLR